VHKLCQDATLQGVTLNLSQVVAREHSLGSCVSPHRFRADEGAALRRRKRNTKVAVHPCPASFGAQDARRGGPVGHAWPSRGTGRARRGRLERRDGRAWTWM